MSFIYDSSNKQLLSLFFSSLWYYYPFGFKYFVTFTM